MSKTQTSNPETADVNFENDLIELSEDELDQIHGGGFWLALPSIASLAISGLKITQAVLEKHPIPNPPLSDTFKSLLLGAGSRFNPLSMPFRRLFE